MSVRKIIKNHIPRSRLSGRLWEKDMKMKKDARKRLLLIADAFIDYLGVPIDVLDITITFFYNFFVVFRICKINDVILNFF